MNHPGCPYRASAPPSLSSPAGSLEGEDAAPLPRPREGTEQVRLAFPRASRRSGRVRPGWTTQIIFIVRQAGFEKAPPWHCLGTRACYSPGPRRSRNRCHVAASLPTAPPPRPFVRRSDPLRVASHTNPVEPHRVCWLPLWVPPPVVLPLRRPCRPSPVPDSVQESCVGLSHANIFRAEHAACVKHSILFKVKRVLCVIRRLLLPRRSEVWLCVGHRHPAKGADEPPE